ncbi:MAG: hypothetical protein AB7U05_01430 [Mangrovibacterium sp.]
MIRMGILSANKNGADSAPAIGKFKELSITHQGLSPESLTGDQTINTAAEIANTTDGLYIELPHPDMNLIRQAIRRSNHLFLKALPMLSAHEIEALISLENEAGCITQIFVPHLFRSKNLKLVGQLETPVLFNFRLAPIPAMNNRELLMHNLLFLVVLEKSNFRKAEVMVLDGGSQISVLDVRLSFSSGTIAHLSFTDQFEADQSVMEIFQKDRPLHVCPLPLLNGAELAASEKNALRQFILAVKRKPAILVSLNELLQARYIFREIEEKLTTSGSSLPE